MFSYDFSEKEDEEKRLRTKINKLTMRKARWIFNKILVDFPNKIQIEDLQGIKVTNKNFDLLQYQNFLCRIFVGDMSFLNESYFDRFYDSMSKNLIDDKYVNWLSQQPEALLWAAYYCSYKQIYFEPFDDYNSGYWSIIDALDKYFRDLAISKNNTSRALHDNNPKNVIKIVVDSSSTYSYLNIAIADWLKFKELWEIHNSHESQISWIEKGNKFMIDSIYEYLNNPKNTNAKPINAPFIRQIPTFKKFYNFSTQDYKAKHLHILAYLASFDLGYHLSTGNNNTKGSLPTPDKIHFIKKLRWAYDSRKKNIEKSNATIKLKKANITKLNQISEKTGESPYQILNRIVENYIEPIGKMENEKKSEKIKTIKTRQFASNILNAGEYLEPYNEFIGQNKKADLVAYKDSIKTNLNETASLTDKGSYTDLISLDLGGDVSDKLTVVVEKNENQFNPNNILRFKENGKSANNRNFRKKKPRKRR